jgi:hypothetical protein
MENDYDDYFEEPEEALLEEPEEMLEESPDIPDVSWKEDIQGIENPILREKEIETAKELLEKEKELLEKVESGEIDQATFEHEYFHKLVPEKSKAATRSALESVGITWDHLGDLSEDWDILVSGDTRVLDLKDQVKEKIREMGPDAAQELADRMLEEEKISEKTHETISRQVRLHRVSSE